ncbi:uncharacterized protein [Haliotis cracherodii]|uniref:uncharacterized protein n=1 Tax=Haliotis cracherodii TaxID=6455 RepID=UPI0039EB92D8
MADQEKRGVFIANGIISGLVLACGTVFSALMGVYFDSLFKEVSNFTGFAYLPVWSLGFGYIVPGLIGLLATCCRAKGGYITQMVFCILTLLAMGIFVVIAGLALTGISYANASCDSSFDDVCTDIAGRFFAVLYSIMVSMILGWVLTLVITILGGVLACRPQTTPGMVMVPMAQVSVLSGSHSQYTGVAPYMVTPATNEGFHAEKY